jgi:hypothetical protein
MENIMVFKILKNVLCLIGIFLSCDYAYRWYCVNYQHQKPEPTALEQVIDTAKNSSEKVIDVAKNSSNAVTDTVGNGFIALGNITKKIQFTVKKPTETKSIQKPQQNIKQTIIVVEQEQIKPEEPTVINDLEKETEKVLLQDPRTKHELIMQLKDSAKTAHNHLQKEDTVQDHEKNLLLARLKEVVTQADHLEKLLQKEPTTETSEAIYNQTIERKMLGLTHKLEIILTDLLNETTGKIIEHRTSKTVFEGIDHTMQLLLSLA